MIDTAKGFDSLKAVYTVKSAGFYLMHMSAGIPANQELRYILNNASSTPNILLTHADYNGNIVTSRDDIQYLSEGQTLYMSTDFTLYSDIMRQTTWSGFKIDDLMSPLIIFRAARKSTSNTYNSYLTLDKLLINVGQGWDSCNNQFIVSRAGIYYLSWSTASSPNTRYVTELHINNKTLTRAFIYKQIFSGADTSSQSLLLQLAVGDKVQIYLSYGPTYSDNNYQTSLIGFLYEPLHGQVVAWTLTMLGSVYIAGPTIVNFNNILLNSGSVWNSESSVVIIPVTGTYFLKLSGGHNYDFNLILLINGQQVMNVMETDGEPYPSWNMRSRSLITELQRGDQLVVTVPNGYQVKSDFNELLFSGFLINII